jgi:hypothetical protein
MVSEACISLGIKHRLHSSLEEKSIIIERPMEYVKDSRTENFDDYYYPCRKKLDCDLNHVYHWFTLLIFLHNIKSYSSSINYLVGGDDKT